MDKEKIESKRLMREMRPEDVLNFPISVLETVRNNVALLNTKHYREGKRWMSKSNKEKGIVEVSMSLDEGSKADKMSELWEG